MTFNEIVMKRQTSVKQKAKVGVWWETVLVFVQRWKVLRHTDLHTCTKLCIRIFITALFIIYTIRGGRGKGKMEGMNLNVHKEKWPTISWDIQSMVNAVQKLRKKWEIKWTNRYGKLSITYSMITFILFKFFSISVKYIKQVRRGHTLNYQQKLPYFSDFKTHTPPNLGGKWGCIL